MIIQRKTGGNFYYQFMKNGTMYRGCCDGCKTKREAEAYEARIKNDVAAIVEKQSTASLVNTFKKSLEGIGENAGAINAEDRADARAALDLLRERLSDGVAVTLQDAFQLYLKQPTRRTASEKQTKKNQTYWNDFAAFMLAKFPEVKNLADVSAKHAKEYISRLRAEGAFLKEINYSRGEKSLSCQIRTDKLSPHTVNARHKAIKAVFARLADDAGLAKNPFDLPTLNNETASREAFTEAELKKIYDNLDDFTRPLFTIAITTALREGDICTLKWSDIDFDLKVIRRQMNKTGKMVEIPITRDLMIYLEELKEKAGESPYVLPEHAQMYLKNRTGITYRVKLFLERLGIQTTRVPKGRTRAVSVKDLHSCRHTFCYYAGLNGIPLAVVQSIVGHMTSEMTRHYSAHATLEDKRKGMDAMPDFMRLPSVQQQKQLATAISVEPEREQLKKLAETLPIITIREILADERCKKALEK